MLKKSEIYIMMAAVILLNHPGYAQESDSQPSKNNQRWWVNLGAGYGGGAPHTDNALTTGVSSVATNASFSYQFGANLISLRAANVTNFTEFIFFFGTGELSSIADVALLYGRSTISGGGHASIAAGIG